MERDLEQRTKRFSLEVIRATSSLPGTRSADFSRVNCCARQRQSARTTAKQTTASRVQTLPTKSAPFKKRLRKRSIGSSC